MKPESLALLKDLSRTLAATDRVIFDTECGDCSMPCDVDCANTCRAYYVMDALNYARSAVLDVLEGIDNA